MSTAKKSTSDKLHLIDKNTFECIQQHRSTVTDDPYNKIRNAKFRKKSAVIGGFNLMQFLTKTPKQKQKAKKLASRHIFKFESCAQKTLKKRGKTREVGKRKNRSRLKKAILQYRQQKSRKETNSEDDVKLLEGHKKQTSAVIIDIKEREEIQERSNCSHKQIKLKTLHSRRFRSYCDNCTTPLLAELTEKILRELDRFQKRAISQNSIKAHAHRRFVVGFREAQSFLLVNKVKLVIIAPDCEICDGEDGLDAKISKIKSQCQQQNIPYLFSLRRRQLGYVLFKKAPISCVAVLDIDGVREIFSKLLEAQQSARETYIEVAVSHLSANDHE